MNMQPVGTFMVTPPTLYSKVRTGVEPTAEALAPVAEVKTSAPAAPMAVMSRAT
ncbi:hypothetical protein ACIQFZ_14295 [Streptomyces sp. NPDC093064]|uniref:hypothetical protein n=1 Tax=unclassified Streptomyces TaxID=2593676 RepID=UPI0036A68BB6